MRLSMPLKATVPQPAKASHLASSPDPYSKTAMPTIHQKNIIELNCVLFQESYVKCRAECLMKN